MQECLEGGGEVILSWGGAESWGAIQVPDGIYLTLLNVVGRATTYRSRVTAAEIWGG